MKRIIIVLLACIALMGASAQNTQKAGSASKAKTEQVTNNNGKKAVKNNGTLTKHTYKGYPVYQGPKGGYYVIRTSKKTGNEYKQYVKPEQFDK